MTHTRVPVFNAVPAHSPQGSWARAGVRATVASVASRAALVFCSECEIELRGILLTR